MSFRLLTRTVLRCTSTISRASSTFSCHSKGVTVVPPISIFSSKNQSISPLMCMLNQQREPSIIQREIRDPLAGLRSEINNPSIPGTRNEISLPEINNTSCVEPVNPSMYEKRAARLVVIRRHKMRKHKWRKLQKKMKFAFAKIRRNREMRKEKAFQGVLLAQIREAEKWTVESFIADQITKTCWKRPVTHVQGFYAPESVIRDHERKQLEARRIEDRIEECLRFKK